MQSSLPFKDNQVRVHRDLKEMINKPFYRFLSFAESVNPKAPAYPFIMILSRYVVLSSSSPAPKCLKLKHIFEDYSEQKLLDVMRMVMRINDYMKIHAITLSEEELLNLIISFFEQYTDIVDLMEDDFIDHSLDAIYPKNLAFPK